MKVRRLELFAGLLAAALGGAIIAKGNIPAGSVTLVFAVLWSIGYFTNDLYEELKGGVELDNRSKNTGLPVTLRQRIQSRGRA